MYKNGINKLEKEYDMKLIANHIKEFDMMTHKFERFMKIHFPKHLKEDKEDKIDHFENFIYFDDEIMQIKIERSLGM